MSTFTGPETDGERWTSTADGLPWARLGGAEGDVRLRDRPRLAFERVGCPPSRRGPRRPRSNDLGGAAGEGLRPLPPQAHSITWPLRLRSWRLKSAEEGALSFRSDSSGCGRRCDTAAAREHRCRPGSPARARSCRARCRGRFRRARQVRPAGRKRCTRLKEARGVNSIEYTPPCPGPGVNRPKPPQRRCITGLPSSNDRVPGPNSRAVTHAPGVLLARLTR